MSVYSLTCTECRAVLNPRNPIPAGRKVRCPKCGALFTTPTSEPVEEKFVAELDEEDDTAASEAEEESSSESRPKRKKRKKRRTAKTPAALVIGLVVGIALLIVGGIVAFVWPGFLIYGTNRGTGNEDPLAYLPGNSTLLLGLDVETVMNQPSLGAMIKDLIARQPNGGTFITDCKRDTGLEFNEICNHLYFGFTNPLGAAEPKGIIVMHSKIPFSQRRVARSFKNATAYRRVGKTYYATLDNGFSNAFMPSDRILTFNNLSQAESDPIMSSNGTQMLFPEGAWTLAGNMLANHFWVVVPFEGSTKQQLQTSLQQSTGPAAALWEPVKIDLAQAHAAGLWGTLDGTRVNLNAGMACASSESAAHAKIGFEAIWQTTKLGMLFLPPSMRKLVEELSQTIRFTSQGPLASASAQVSLQALVDFVKEAQQRRASQPPRM